MMVVVMTTDGVAEDDAEVGNKARGRIDEEESEERDERREKNVGSNIIHGVCRILGRKGGCLCVNILMGRAWV